jgi:hypothetical protein
MLQIIFKIGDYALKTKKAKLYLLLNEKALIIWLRKVKSITLSSKLDELEKIKNSALVIEADYSHFLDTKK